MSQSQIYYGCQFQIAHTHKTTKHATILTGTVKFTTKSSILQSPLTQDSEVLNRESENKYIAVTQIFRITTWNTCNVLSRLNVSTIKALCY